MISLENLEKIKEYECFVLFKHKNTGVRECFLKIELNPPKNLKAKGEKN